MKEEDPHPQEISRIAPGVFVVNDWDRGKVFEGTLDDCHRFVQWQKNSRDIAQNDGPVIIQRGLERYVTFTLPQEDFHLIVENLREQYEQLHRDPENNRPLIEAIAPLLDCIDPSLVTCP